MNSVDRFLRDATRGLGRKARLEAQAELRSHLHERVQALRLEGVAEAEASAQAMRELGPAATVRRSLWGAHPPLHLLWLSLPLMLAVGAWNLRDVQTGRSYHRGQQADLYGSIGFIGRFDGGIRLEAWTPDLPQGLKVITTEGQPILTAAGLPPIPLTGGPRSDRPLILHTQDLITQQDSFRRTPDGRMVPTIPEWMTGFVRVRGPFINTANLATRAFRLGWPVRVNKQQINLAGRALPATPRSNLGLDSLAADLAVASLWLRVPPTLRPHIGEAWAVGGLHRAAPSEAPWAAVTQTLTLNSAQPGAWYVLISRIPPQDSQRASSEGSDLMVSLTHKANLGGTVQFPLSNHLPARGLKYRAAHLRLMGDVETWSRRPVSSTEFPTLVLQVFETFQRGLTPVVFAPPEALDRLFPLEETSP